MIICEKCGRSNEDHFRFCLGCGANLDEQRSRAQAPPPAPPTACPSCGAPLSPEQRFCGVCGARIDAVAGAAPAAPAAVAPSPVVPPPANPFAAAPVNPFAAAPAANPFVAPPAPQPVPVAPAPAAVSAPAAPPSAISGAVGPQVGSLTMLRPDGSSGDVYPLRPGENNVGRATPADVFARDPHLSPLHATFIIDGNQVRVIDRESVNGIYYRIHEPTQLAHGDFIRIGQELLRFELLTETAPMIADDGQGTTVAGTPRRGAWGRLERISAPGEASFSFVLRNAEHVLGRERGDILFRDDGYVSGMHARVYAHDGRVYLEDLGSSNGTFVRIRNERVLASGALILMGQQPFRIQIG